MLVSILIVNYNTGKILRECIESVFKFEGEFNFEIIVVDNFSTDDSKNIIGSLAGQFGNMKIKFLESKTSFSAANNDGFAISQGEYILIMNPDIIFEEPLLERMIKDLNSNSELGAVIPLLIGTDRKFQSRYFQKYPGLLQFILFYSVIAKLFVKSKRLTYKYLNVNCEDFGKDTFECVDQIPCAFFFTKRDVFIQAGKMDERYRLFFEDVDLSYQVNKSLKLAVDTGVSVTHLGGESFKTSDDFWLYGRFIISMIIFSKKNYGSFNSFALKSVSVLNSYVILATEKIKGIFWKSDEYRIRKHRYFLNELGKTKL